MKFLVDENLSPKVAEFLLKSGHDAVHVRDLDAAGAPDSGVMALAAGSGRVIVSADTVDALRSPATPARLRNRTVTALGSERADS